MKRKRTTRLTDEEKRVIREYPGTSVAIIAKAIDVTPKTIITWLRKWGLYVERTNYKPIVPRRSKLRCSRCTILLKYDPPDNGGQMCQECCDELLKEPPKALDNSNNSLYDEYEIARDVEEREGVQDA